MLAAPRGRMPEARQDEALTVGEPARDDGRLAPRVLELPAISSAGTANESRSRTPSDTSSAAWDAIMASGYLEHDRPDRRREAERVVLVQVDDGGQSPAPEDLEVRVLPA